MLAEPKRMPRRRNGSSASIERILLTAIFFASTSIFTWLRFAPSSLSTSGGGIDEFSLSFLENNKSPSQNYISSPEEDPPEPFSFSACLLIKDANALLPEWLAYHYTVLPLRRLIVAVDPMSHTDPRPILDAYRSIGMNITVWVNESTYWENRVNVTSGLSDFNPQKKNDPNYMKNLADMYKWRQQRFLQACLQTLHDEGRTWTAIVDVDEYVAFNYYDANEGPPSFCKGNTTCEDDYLHSIKDETHFRMRFDESLTAAEYINSHIDASFDNVAKPCIMIGRYLFVSQEYGGEENDIQRGINDKEFNASMFHTLRYRYRSPLSQAQLNGKSIVDVSRYDGRFIHNPHRTLGNLCTGNNAQVHNSEKSFRVHHYVGSFQSFISPGFDARGMATFRQRNNLWNLVLDNTTPGYSRYNNSSWISRFAHLVGKERALALTQSMRMREELEHITVVLGQQNIGVQEEIELLKAKIADEQALGVRR